MRPLIKATIQKLPAEVLMDLSIEADVFLSPTVEKQKNVNETTAGFFDPNIDRINIGLNSLEQIMPTTITHELGHAIDWHKGNKTNNYGTANNNNFIKAYNNAINAWKHSGKQSDRLYLFKNLQEGFAEWYSIAMIGYSHASTGAAVTPELSDAGLKQLEDIRALKDNDRHKR